MYRCKKQLKRKIDSGEYMKMIGIPAQAGRGREPLGEHKLIHHYFISRFPAALFWVTEEASPVSRQGTLPPGKLWTKMDLLQVNKE